MDLGLIGTSIQTSAISGEVGSTINSGISREIASSSISGLSKSDSMSSKFNSGEIPAVRSGLINKLANAPGNIARGTMSAAGDFGNVIANDVLPKPEPLSTTLLRNKFLGAILVGGFINGLQGLVKVATGEYTRDEAVHQVAKDTSMGAISGLSFASGMGITASVLGGIMGIGGVPLSIAALTIGTLSSMGAAKLATTYIPFFADKKPVK
ncbi:MAG: hypothetical protein H7263_14445 [Candidatus Sericytochromatia bacterium]|nr:hypothetical protein [Candidatus Sericytochromatia bacterium]